MAEVSGVAISMKENYFVEGDLLWKIVNSNKGIEILRTLRDDGAKGVRELQESVGGSLITITERKEEFAKAGLIEIEEEKDWPYSKRLVITPRGERLISRIDRFFGN